ncbi:MAG: ABC transporter permease [Theionarchaea archaeon]|nr:ABC transporter permease [Theionarchaea archaeon]
MGMKERIFGMTLKSIVRKKMRSGLTVLGIAIGIMLVTALLMVSTGLEAQFKRVVEEGGGDFVVMDKTAPDLMLSRVDSTAQQAIERMGGISWVSGMIFTTAQIGDRPYVMMFGVETTERNLQQFKIIQGRTLNQDDRGKIIMGRTIAVQEGYQVGSTLEIKGSSFSVVGIYETGASFEDGGVIMSLSEVQTLFDMRNLVSLLQVKAEDTTNAEAIRAEVESTFPKFIALKSTDVASKQEDLQLITSISALISLIAIVVGSIIVMNTMIMSVMERTREIGILRAVGWKSRKVLSMVLKESLAMSIIGGVIGIVIAAGLVNALAKAAQLPVDLPVTADLVVSAFIIAVILGFLGGFYPALRASRMSPMEALSHE